MTTNLITPESFTRVNNDVNGNPRYVIHFLDLLTDEDFKSHNNYMTENEGKSFNQLLSRTQCGYNKAVKKAKKIGGRKHSTKAFAGGIVFQSYNLPTLAKECNQLLTDKK